MAALLRKAPAVLALFPLLIASPALAGAAPAADTHTCDDAQQFFDPEIGTVSAGTPDHWYYDTAFFTTYTLLPLDGDADLYIYDTTWWGCFFPVCSSIKGTGMPDQCTVGGGLVWIQVHYYSSPTGSVDYVLTTGVPPLPDVLAV